MKTDAQIQQDVLDEVAWEPAIKSQEIDATVKEGVVTLTGRVTSYAEKIAVERAAQRVMGVKGLAVDLTVRLPPISGRSDSDIALAAEHALQWNVLIPEDSVRPMVEGGWVTLNGEVDWDYQRRAAERAVRELTGVLGVTNSIKVMPKVAPTSVKKSIHDALSRQADREANQIRVEVDGAKVKLCGKVHSWAELNAVKGAAWSAPGVESVTVDLVVSS